MTAQPVWTTQNGQRVGVGDEVALDLLDDKDTVVRIEAPLESGAILCRIVRASTRKAIGKYYLATEDQFLMKIPQRGEQCCAGPNRPT